MLIQNDYGKVDFWTPWPNLNKFKKIGINLSGGTDSALLMYMTCLYITNNNVDASIVPITGVHDLRPTNIWNATEIVLLMQELFPSVSFNNHEINYYSKSSEKDKVNHHIKHETSLFESDKIHVLFHGRTSNPPIEIAEQNNLMDKRELIRDVSVNKIVYHENHDKPFYCPFNNVDKRFINECYIAYNLLDTLFPITASCVEYANKTSFFSTPCKKCWWCREKYWAFGMYDGGVK